MGSDRAHTPPPAAGGGLVVQDGPGAGTSFPFHYPVTLVGRSGGCDVRLDAGDVRPLHCLLTPGPAGVNLRALAKDTVRVNGRPATSATLRDGDLLEIGPCRLRVRYPSAGPAADDALLESLRIQAAAVAAQQAALTDWECSLADRAAALQRQESELAGHLDDQRRQLMDLHEQIAQARVSLREKRSAFATLAAEQEAELAAVRQDAYDRRSAVERREARVARLWSKFRRHVRLNREARRAQAAREAAALAAQHEELEVARRRFDDFRRQFHARAELEKRAIADAESRVRAAAAEDRELRVCLNQHARDLARREKAVAAETNRLAAERQRGETRLAARQAEADRLESRAAAARAVLADRQREAEQLGFLFARIAHNADEPAAGADPLARQAGDLADQRALLAEQVQRFAAARLAWEAERSRALADLDALVDRQADRERELGRREVELAEAEAQLAEERDGLARLTLRLEADRQRAAADVAALRSAVERDAGAVEARIREADRRQQGLVELYQRWGRRRSAELLRLRQSRQAADVERESWAALRDDWLHARARLLREQHDVSARQLALEKYRQECIDAAERPELAERRLERLHKQWQGVCSIQRRELDRLAAVLAGEVARLDARNVQTCRGETTRSERDVQAGDSLAEADVRQLQADVARVQWQERLAEAEGRYDQAVQELATLRDQFERLAMTLVEAPPASARAA
jgi:hypothetical protein